MTTEQDLLALCKKIDKLLIKDSGGSSAEEAAAVLAALAAVTDMSELLLRRTKVAFAVDRLRKSALLDESGKRVAKDLLKQWQKLASTATSSSTSSKARAKEGHKTSSEKSSSGGGKKGAAVEREAPIDFKITAEPPKRNKHGQLQFENHPEFLPNLTPKEVLQAGSFGGTYFRPIYSSVTKQKYGSEVWKELPKDWLEGLNIKTQVCSSIYDTSRNKYKVKCGASLEEWENSGWMRAQDPYGWFQWYCRFYQGRRTDDDERQIGRWKNCAGPKGRWKNNLISKIAKAGVAFDNYGISPVVRQTLLHWAYELTKEDYEKGAKKFKK